jgi:dihydroorotate dehydrogenase
VAWGSFGCDVDSGFAKYDITQDYAWNYERAPEPVGDAVPGVDGEWLYCGVPVDSPLGIAAGPLLNGKWLLYYASLGFDVLTYKTVRSCERRSYGLPNLQPIAWEGGVVPAELSVASVMNGSWAVSFGMPSKPPSFWRDDVAATRSRLAKGKFLCVSVVATAQDGWSIDDLAADYAQCARWAVESGADGVEANFSCPNVSSVDGQLFLNPTDAGIVAAQLREALPDTPLLLKVGHINNRETAHALVEVVAPSADALVMVNGLSAKVRQRNAELLFEGQCRGIAGEVIRETTLEQLALFDGLIREFGIDVRLVGVGGLGQAADVRACLDRGCEAVQFATAAMLNPGLGLAIRREGF